jgi:tungstate transport system ATP-binding protein
VILYTLTEISQRYLEREVLHIDQLDIEAGRIHALLGPNGAGKTTLLKLLAFLEPPTGGVLTFCGEPVDPVPDRLIALRRRVTLVEQHPIMFSTTVSANIEFGLKIRKMAREERQRRVDEVLMLVGLTRYSAAPAYKLSGGETQRLALARGLALRPEVLLCDEPTAGVDVDNQAIITELLHRINADLGTTIVFTSHDRAQAASLAHHLLVLDKGRLIRSSHENIFSCTLIENTRDQWICRLNTTVTIPLNNRCALAPSGTKGRMTIMPEAISVERLSNQPYQTEAQLGTVIRMNTEGSRIRLVVDIGVPLVIVLDRADYLRLCPMLGETMRLRFAPEGITFHAD